MANWWDSDPVVAAPQQAASPAPQAAAPAAQENWWSADPVVGQPAPGAQPSTVQRAEVPAGITRITVNPSNPAAPAPQPQASAPAPAPNAPDNFGQILTDFQNQGLAASQGTTPNVQAQQPNLISDNVQEGDDGNAYFVGPGGALQQVDTAKQVVLRDPSDNRLKVFARTDDTNEGRLSSAGRLLQTGLGAGAPTARSFAPVAQVAQEVRPGQQVVAAANRLSQTGAPVQIPRAVATDSMPIQQIASAASNVPIAGTPLVKAAERTIGQLGSKADEVAQGFGSAGSTEHAGDVARTGIRNWITGESGKTANKLYKRVDTLVNPDVTTPLNATTEAVSNILAKRTAAGLNPGKAVNSVIDAVRVPGGLTYQGVKTLRTSIGETLDSGILPEGVSGSELKQIYSSLTKDLETSVQTAGGGKASAAFKRANQYYNLASSRREALAKIVGANGDAPAETVLNRLQAMASSSSRADIAKLVQARKAIGSDDWNEIVSTIVAGLGRDVEGDFSPQRFVTAYGKISPAGKQVLFRSGGKSELASHLDDIAKVSSRFKELQKFANPSGTARAGFGGLIGAGGLTAPLVTLKLVIGGRVLASVLSKPASAASVAKFAHAQEALVRAPGPARLAAFNAASRNLINTIGAKNLSPDDFLRALQGSAQTRAQDEQPEPVRVVH